MGQIDRQLEILKRIFLEILGHTVQFYLKQVKNHVPSEIFPFSIPILITDSFKRTFKKIPWAENGQK